MPTPSARRRPRRPRCRPGASEEDVKNIIWQQLKTCYDPEIPVNIVDLGLVYECDVSKNEDATRTVDIKMTLTAPGCGMGEVLVQDVRDKVQIVPTVARRQRRTGIRSAVEPDHDVGRGPPADRHDVRATSDLSDGDIIL